MNNGTVRRWLQAMALALAAAVLVERAWSQVDWAAKLPEGDGKDLTIQLCGSCHDLGRSVNVTKDAKAWEQTVSNMISRGAQIFPDEAEKITKYLAAHFGTNSSPGK